MIPYIWAKEICDVLIIKTSRIWRFSVHFVCSCSHQQWHWQLVHSNIFTLQWLRPQVVLLLQILLLLCKYIFYLCVLCVAVSIDAYRSTRVKETERPGVKQVIVRKENVCQRAEEPRGSSLFSVKQKMKVWISLIWIQFSCDLRCAQSLLRGVCRFWTVRWTFSRRSFIRPVRRSTAAQTKSTAKGPRWRPRLRGCCWWQVSPSGHGLSFIIFIPISDLTGRFTLILSNVSQSSVFSCFDTSSGEEGSADGRAGSSERRTVGAEKDPHTPRLSQHFCLQGLRHPAGAAPPSQGRLCLLHSQQAR